MRRFIKLDQELKTNKEKEEKLKEQRREVEARIIASMEKAGVQRVTQDGHTVYIRRELWASAPGPEGVSTLKEAGYEEFIREGVVSQSLSAWVRERAREHPLEPGESLELLLPEELRGRIKVSEKIEARVTKA